MKAQLIFFIVLFTIIVSSCTTPAGHDKVKSDYWIHKTRIIEGSTPAFDTTYIQGGITMTYTYDDKGNRTSITSSDGSKTVFEHVGSTIVETKTDSAGKVISKQTDFLNDKERTDSFVVEKNGKVAEARKLIYDDQGVKIEERTYQLYKPLNILRLAIISKFNMQDSNLVSEIQHIIPATDTTVMVNPKTLKPDTTIQRIANIETTYYWEYFTDKLNTSHGNSNSKNLPKRMVEVVSPADTSVINNYRYTFDDKDRVITEVFESTPGSEYRAGTTTELDYDSTAHTYY